MKITVHTIARDLNVAPSTVSNALNNKGNLSKEKREEIIAYCNQVGYVPSLTARLLKTRKSYLIGVILNEEWNVGLAHPFFSKILQSFKERIEVDGYSMTFIVKSLGDTKQSYVQWCKSKHVDAVFIAVGDEKDPAILELVDSDIPCVSCDVLTDNLTSVISSNVMGMKQCFKFLEEQEFKTIGFVSGPLDTTHFKFRHNYFVDNVSNYNFECSKDNVLIASNYGYNSGFKVANELVKKGNLPDCLMVASDVLAFGVIDGLLSKGINVPNDISVIGFDDIDFSQYFKPSLSTIRQDTKTIGISCAEELLNMISNSPTESKVVAVPTQLIVRESVKIKRRGN